MWRLIIKPVILRVILNVLIRFRAKYIIIIGEEEVQNKFLTIKNNVTKDEYKVELDNLIEFLDEKLGDDDED